MLKHSLLFIYRNFKRYKSTFFINLVGLSTGLACALLIYLWINDQLSFDKFHEKDLQLFQVMQNMPDARGIQTIEFTPGLLAKELAAEMPEIEYASSVMPSNFFPYKGILSLGDSVLVKASEQYAGKDYFNIFSYKLVQGNKDEVLTDKYAVVLSQSLARKLFGDNRNVIGKMVEWDRQGFSGVYQVSGVFEDLPANTSDAFDMVFNYELFYEKFPPLQSWGNNAPSTYLVLNKTADVNQLNTKIAGFIKTKFKESTGTLFVRRYSDKYLYGKYENGVQTGGRIEYIRLFSVIALFILAIACINFMNLSTAKAAGRMKEVGVKKTVGAGRRTLIIQYLGESMVVTLMSLVLAFIMVVLLLPRFNDITGKSLELSFDRNIAMAVIGITVFTGLASGSYPALYLSGFKPAAVLKGKLNTSAGEVWTRKVLTVFQFSVSVVLIVLVLIVYKQMEFVQSKNLGYNRDNIIHFKSDGRLNEDLETFLGEIEKIPGVLGAANMAYDISRPNGTTSGVQWEGNNQQGDEKKIVFANLEVGYNLIELFGIEMLEGRAFSRDFADEKTKIIFNQAAIESMGLENPVGKTVTLWGQPKEIIGVAKNFHFESLYETVKPCFFQFSPNGNNIVVKIKAGTEKELVERLEKFYHEQNHGLAFEFKFLDQEYQEIYTSEKRVSVLSRYFAGIAILISCLGLFGLAAFTAERRLKEIGIRKVFGSSEVSVIYLLSSDFTRIVLVSLLIALPVSYYIAVNWLNKFAYRIDLEWWFFAASGLAALMIAWFTIGIQTLKAARVNPTECLRSE